MNGRKGKELAKSLLKRDIDFFWFSSNKNKIGKDIYGQIIRSPELMDEIKNKKTIIAISGPDDQEEVKNELSSKSLKEGRDYYFFC